MLLKLKENISKYHKHFMAGALVLVLGIFIGYLSGGGIVEKIAEDEATKSRSEDAYQYLPMDGSLEDALSSGHYSHCVVYSGVGLKFEGKDNNKNLIVGQSYLTYPANKANIFPGTKVLTPLDVIKGDLGSPVKIEFKQGLETKSAILKRVMMKKCLKKSGTLDEQGY